MPLTLATQSATQPATQSGREPEIFASIQGEGPSIGMPVSFIRLSRCNLGCTWCDTAYTWNFGGDISGRPHRDDTTYDREANQITLSIAEAAERIEALGQRRLVITGGEPLLQGAALADMLQLLPDYAVEVETNGSVKPPARLDMRVDQYNISPKLSHSGNPAELALVPERLAAYAEDPRGFFKFVISAPEDVAEVLALQKQYHIKSERLFLMAEGVESAALREKQQWLVPLCLKHGFRLSDRLHIHLFGDSRGT